MIGMENYDVFDDYIDEIFQTSNTKDTSVDNSEQIQYVFKERYLDFLYNGSETTQKYHMQILSQAQKLLFMFSILFVCVTGFIALMVLILIILNIEYTKFLVPLIISGFTDFISGILVIVMNKLFKSRDEYFEKNIISEHFSKIIGLIQTMKNEDDKTKMIEKIVDDYCAANKR